MKAEIHPKYETTKVICSCGNAFETRSTLYPEIKVEICYNCHPFYTGTQKLVDTAGRVEKFRTRVSKASTERKKKVKPSGKNAKKG